MPHVFCAYVQVETTNLPTSGFSRKSFKETLREVLRQHDCYNWSRDASINLSHLLNDVYQW